MNRLIVVLPLIAILAVGCGYTAQPQPVLPTFLPVQQIPTTEVSSYPTMQAPQSNSSQSIGGFQVNLQRAWRDGKQVYGDVCFTLPDASDWTIWNAHLDYGNQSITNFGASLLDTTGAANGQPGQRCDQLSFYVPPDANLASASLTVESLGAYPTQDEYCSLYMPKIQQTLNSRGVAITLGCPSVNGVQSMQIISKPDSMSEQDAEKLVYSDEFYTVKGPWVFSISLGQ